MPRVNLVTVGTQGVDLRVNPLFVTNSRLRSAINLAFEEGVIRTRPGVFYESTGVRGKLKGVAEYRPAQGLSSQSFAADTHALVFVVDNTVYRKPTGQLACEIHGNVDFDKSKQVWIFQAENYLILQSPESSTFWYDGVELTRSPGMIETDWYDTEAPWDEVHVRRPVSEHPDCGENPCVDDPNTCPATIVVINVLTGAPIPGVPLRITYNKNLAHEGTTNAQGRLVLRVVPRRYRVDVQHSPYETIEQQPLDLRTCEDQVIALRPIFVEGQCGESFTLEVTSEPTETPLVLGSAIGTFELGVDTDDTPTLVEVIYDGEVILSETVTGADTLSFTKPDYKPYEATLRVSFDGEGPESEPSPIASFILTCPPDPADPNAGLEPCDGECDFSLSDPEIEAVGDDGVRVYLTVTNETNCPISVWQAGFLEEGAVTMHGGYEEFNTLGESSSFNNYVLGPLDSVRIRVALIDYSSTLTDFVFVLGANTCNGVSLGVPSGTGENYVLRTLDLNA
jgi:hypothetical protein